MQGKGWEGSQKGGSPHQLPRGQLELPPVGFSRTPVGGTLPSQPSPGARRLGHFYAPSPQPLSRVALEVRVHALTCGKTNFQGFRKKTISKEMELPAGRRQQETPEEVRPRGPVGACYFTSFSALVCLSCSKGDLYPPFCSNPVAFAPLLLPSPCCHLDHRRP